MSELIRDANGIWIDKEKSLISYPEEGNVNSFSLEDNSFWFNHRNNILKQIIKRFPFPSNFADIGGGNGYQAKFILDNYPNKKIFLVEPGYQGCVNAKKRGLENVYNVTFQKFNFSDNNVNAVGLFDVLEHIEYDADFLIQLKSALPKDSLIYITVPSHMYLWSDVDNFGGHYRRYDKKMIDELVQKTKMELVYFSYFFTYLPILTFMLRRIPYLLKGKRESSAILDKEKENQNPSKIVLSVFNFFHRWELRKINNNRINHGASCVFILKA